MKNTVRERILLSLKKLMSGIIRLCLRNGVTCKELISLCKSLYVEICASEYGINGRQTNISRIALMTGLDRKEIKKTLDQHTEKSDIKNHSPDRIAKILGSWHQDKNYLDNNKQPLAIPAEGPSPSFEALAKNLRGDMPTVTILKELKRSKTIIENKEGLLEVQKAYFIPNYFSSSDNEPDLISPVALEHGSSMLVDHINTIFYNLYRQEKLLRNRLELRATNNEIPVTKIKAFQDLVDEKAMELLYELDNWLEENKADNDKVKTERLGLGLYLIQGKNQNLKFENTQKNQETTAKCLD